MRSTSNMIYGVLDLETEVYKSFGWNKVGNPHDLRNFVVSFAFKSSIYLENFIYSQYYTEYVFEPMLKECICTCDMIVCHNAKFDILFLWNRYEWFRDWIVNGGKIWCTMLAEHIISGQRESYMSLDRASAKYGGELKDDRVAELWGRGYETVDIDKKMLMDYNEGDVKNTDIVFKEQIKELKKKNQLKLAKMHMEDLLFVIKTSSDGLYVNIDLARQALTDTKAELKDLESQILEKISSKVQEVPLSSWNINSSEQMSSLFFGGPRRWKERGPILDEDGEPERFKTKNALNYGEIKTKLHEREVIIEGLGYKPLPEWKNKKDKVYSTNEKVVTVLAKRCEIAKLLLKYNKTETILSKYLTKMADLVYEKDSCLHADFTIDQISGRMGAKNPPIATIPRDL